MILVTGGTGYIGSHTTLELLNAGYDVLVMDNLSNSSRKSLRRVENLTGKKALFVEADLLDETAMYSLFKNYPIHSVIHFAGLKAVGESVEKPLYYYRNNVAGTLILCEAMQQFGVKKLVFSSSATVYGNPTQSPLVESSSLSAVNPYGQTKLTIEHILRDLGHADPEWRIALLRYFNPVGAHESGLIGEDPRGIPNNLMPYITQVAVGRLAKLRVFGNDYPTSDGTGVRDYIHVVDLALGHLKALEKLETTSGVEPYNLGTGTGTSVLELVRAFEEASGVEIPYEITDRRPGDAATCFADPSKAERELSWRAQFDIVRMCEDSWRWQSGNPEGYA